MIQQKLFLGVLEITINSPCEVNWRKEEQKFFKWSVPTKKEISVCMKFSSELPTSNGKKIYHTDSMDIYVDEYEERYYYPTYVGEQSVATYSKLCGDHVYVEQIKDKGIWNNPNFYLLTHIHLEQLLLDVGALVLHSCYTAYKGKAILFTAPSGTGKTTQAEIWKCIYGTRIVNGDKCIL